MIRVSKGQVVKVSQWLLQLIDCVFLKVKKKNSDQKGQLGVKKRDHLESSDCHWFMEHILSLVEVLAYRNTSWDYEYDITIG